MLVDFLDMLCILFLLALIVIAYVIHIDQKVEFKRGVFKINYTYLNAVIDDFKFISIGIIVLIAVIMAVRAIFILFRMIC